MGMGDELGSTLLTKHFFNFMHKSAFSWSLEGANEYYAKVTDFTMFFLIYCLWSLSAFSTPETGFISASTLTGRGFSPTLIYASYAFQVYAYLGICPIVTPDLVVSS